MLAGIGHAWPTGTQCAAWLSTLLSRAARLYKYHSRRNHRMQVQASPRVPMSGHHSPFPCPLLRHPNTLTPDPGHSHFQPSETYVIPTGD